ncbi:CHASE domain-containing protein [Massilia scottii]|uniref:CHASE domain-containing protein n=1 Tax=Massilia scottii TaxID=3057166 RepID=UPI002796427B|nr:CHASE domain-containing protein [Massilia sp. CCM 9029]MDQ1829266.1 CHASE domain-containing protein [Massilia sp. CCM 9029]
MPTSVDQPDEKRSGGPGIARLRGKYAPLILALSIFLLALTATGFAWQFARTQLLDSQNAEFAFEARQMERRIEQRMATYEQVQRGTQAFLLGSMQVERKDFRAYIATLRLEETYPGIQGIALVELVAPERLDAHIAAQRRESPGYTVRPPGPRPVFSAITHIEPLTGLNLRALGFDMLSDLTRRVAMERARDTGHAAASGKVRLIQENGRNEQAGLVMYLPVYRRDAPTATVAERRAHIIGWVGAPFRMDDLMAGLGGERSSDIMLSIYDGNTVDDSTRLFRSARETAAEMQREARFSTTLRVVVAGRPWTLQMRSAAQFEARLQSDRPQFIAIVGVAAAALLALLVWTLASGRGRAMALAAETTQQLSASEFRWKYALEGAGDGVWDWNRGTGAIVHSRRWKEMLGYGAEEIAPNNAAFEALIHDEDRARVLATLNAYVDSTDQSYECQFRLRCKNGTWRWIRSRGMAVTRDAQGHPLRTIGTHTDITRAKADERTLVEANARLAAEQHRVSVILDHSHDAFVAVSADGCITDWNAKAEAMFGWPAAAAIGHDLAELIIPPELRAAHNAGIARMVASGTGTVIRNVFEVSALHRDGRRVPVELAIAGFPQASGFVVSAFMRDVSERKQAEQLEVERSRALEDARHALQHSQKLEAVGKLTGGVAHDFNNVLHVIGGNVQLLQLSNRDDARLQRRLLSMQSAVDRGAKLASQLLAFARRQPLQPVVLNPLQTLQAMDDLLQRALGESVQIRIEADDGLWNTLVDPGQWENVVINLAINARDAMPGGGVLTVGLRNQRIDAGQAGALLDLAPGDYIRFSFADTGQGMDGEVMAHAFEPFFTTKPVGQGTGLGLSMAYGFVKQSGGHIVLESKPGKGTTVVIYLPRSADRASGKAAAAEQNVVGGGETILVVEDDAEVRATTVATLNELGYCVLEAHDGASAWAMVRGGAWIDLLFTDVVMPGPVSSIELALLVQQALPGVAVLYTSGYTRDALTTGGRLDDGVRLLGKPYRRTQLAQHVRDALAGRTLGRLNDMPS